MNFSTRTKAFFSLIACLFFIAGSYAQAPGTVKSYSKIVVEAGSPLADSPALWKWLGAGACMVRDVDGDGNPELMTVSLNANSRYVLHQIRLNSSGHAKPGFRY